MNNCIKPIFIYLVLILINTSCHDSSNDHNEVFRTFKNGICTIRVSGFPEQSYINIYQFPRKNKSYKLENKKFISFPLFFPTATNYMILDGINKNNLFLTPSDTIDLVIKDGKMRLLNSKHQSINEYYVKNTFKQGMDLFSISDTTHLDDLPKAFDNILDKELDSLNRHKCLPKWFYEYELSRIRSVLFFHLSINMARQLSNSEFIEFFEKNFDFSNQFNSYQYSNYSSIKYYLDHFNSENLNKSIKESRSWLVGMEERAKQTTSILPKQYRDINLANQLMSRIDFGMISKAELKKEYFSLFSNKVWFEILLNSFPEDKNMLKIGDQTPYFYLPNSKGTYLEPYQLNGKYTYINFWAFWCKPCLKRFPDDNQLAEKHRDINYVNLNLDSDSVRWLEFSKESISNASINLWANKNWTKKLMNQFNINSLPRGIIINPNGKIDMLSPPLSNKKQDSLFSHLIKSN